MGEKFFTRKRMRDKLALLKIKNYDIKNFYAYCFFGRFYRLDFVPVID